MDERAVRRQQPAVANREAHGGYNTLSGTSMASPHAAGAAALYKATHPSAE